MNSELKRELCNYLIKNRLVKPYQVIVHSYTRNRMGGVIKNMTDTSIYHQLLHQDAIV